MTPADLDALIERMKAPCIEYLCTRCSAERHECIDALVQLRDENARLLSDPMNVGWQRAQDAIKDRAAAVSQWKAAIEWQDCALVMQTERDAWKSKLLAEEVEHDATMAERDALKAERADLIKINNKWAGEWDAMREQVEEMRKVIEAAKANRETLSEIAGSKSLTATPTQFYQHLQRIAAKATAGPFDDLLAALDKGQK